MNNQVLSCLDIIAKCNDELQRLVNHPEEANTKVDAPGRYYHGHGHTITRKNQVELERDEQIDILRRIFSGYNIGIRSNAHYLDEYTGPRYLAFIDILGFSEIVRNNSEEELTKFVNFLIRDVQAYMVSEEVGQTKTKLYIDGSLAPDLSGASLNSLMFSDTILYWTADDSAESFYEIVKSIRNLIHWMSYYTNVALRGVITCGELNFLDFDIPHQSLTINQSTLYGKSIVEAYHEEGKQEWLGCIITSKALESYIQHKPSEDKLQKLLTDFLVEYEVPMKQDRTERHNVINWSGFRFTEEERHTIKRCFTKFQKQEDITNEAVKLKYENTLKFLDFANQQRLTKKTV